MTGSKILEGDSSIILDMKNKELVAVAKWVDFYDAHANYTLVGFVQGQYFDKYGFPTASYKEYRRRVEEERATIFLHAKQYPKCNFKSKSGNQKQLWCENGSHYPTKLEGSEQCFCIDAVDISKRKDIVAYTNCQMENRICYEQVK